MKKTALSAITALALFTSAEAMAQAVAVEIGPDQRTRIREYVVTQRVRPVTIPDRVVIGATLPGDVELVAVPSEWGPSFSRYRYIYTNNQVVLVEPSSRRVIQVID